jgi:site-specific recombinase XerD
MYPMTVVIQDFRAYLQRRNYSAYTLDSYTLDLQLFFADSDKASDQVTFGDVDRFIARHYQQGLAPATINRRWSALKPFFAFRLDRQVVSGNPVQPSQVLRRARTLPRALAQEQVDQLFAQMPHPLDRALFLLMLRCGLRVSEVARLKLRDIDWAQQAVLVEQGKGRQDRRVYLSADAVASLRACLQQRPRGVPAEAVFWNQKRPHHPLSVKAIQKKRERDAKAAGLVASCHRLRQTFASNLLEQGAEIVSIRELLGHASLASSERDAKGSNQKLKQVDVKTMRKVLQQSKV